MIPDRAVITAKTEEEAQRLINFLVDNGCYWPYEDRRTNWREEGEETCYDIEGTNKQIMHCFREWYEDRVCEYDKGEDPDESDWIPADRSWLFISTDEFIARCTAEDDVDSNVDISCLM